MQGIHDEGTSSKILKPFMCLKKCFSVSLPERWNQAALLGGKYLARNFSTISFHVVMDPGAKEVSHLYAAPLRLNGNSLNLMASSDTELILKVEQIWRKQDK